MDSLFYFSLLSLSLFSLNLSLGDLTKIRVNAAINARRNSRALGPFFSPLFRTRTHTHMYTRQIHQERVH